jgi:hypothetical protein
MGFTKHADIPKEDAKPLTPQEIKDLDAIKASLVTPKKSQ